MISHPASNQFGQASAIRITKTLVERTSIAATKLRFTLNTRHFYLQPSIPSHSALPARF
jgi:hypothetical protein